MSSAPSLLIFGGAGFLGQRVAQSAIAKGWQVTSITRSGAPPATGQDWDKVRWVRGDAFEPASYQAEIAKANHIISTIGILDYRGIRKQKSWRYRVDAIGSTFYDAVKDTTTSDALNIYDRLNRDSLKAIVDQVYNGKSANLQSFAYVSAADGFPGIPKRYIESKRQAEQYLQQQSASAPWRTIIYRPGFMYADSSPLLSTLSRVVGVTYALNSSLGVSNKLASLTNGRLSLGAAGVKPLPVTRVADALVEGCALAEGTLDVYKIEALADVRWRNDMIK
ncbi:hypothetical protein BCR37DRAFT_251430 [Protomyces lactucae-debilis]|uniref:NAD(P)-binding domain-containing protein n=1 Tax=Protomyces lactucae-debilis TaxID=2754530 RepID=A0A1Y2FNI2_PROLT|nr:uncharacterized protein BCR37DRAFT_251430 [Protomyces lactucae-debilis]ORY84776.1 hypothetical protein BCR37DRAFT_251430 [Protomyces lactucae-debilis]